MRRMTCRNGFVFVAAICLGLMVTSARGGDLNPPAGPESTNSAMFTLENVYNYLTTGVRASKRSGGFTEPAAGPTVGTMRTLNAIMEAAIIPPKTGVTTSYATRDDGDIQAGLAWPNPRFSPVGTGDAADQIRDNLTGLIWARKANQFSDADWATAMNSCNNLTYGGTNDWRLPNIRELQSLIDYRWVSPALCNTAGTAHWTFGDSLFTGITATFYWSSTKREGADQKQYVDMNTGDATCGGVANAFYVWPVRGGR